MLVEADSKIHVHVHRPIAQMSKSSDQKGLTFLPRSGRREDGSIAQ